MIDLILLRVTKIFSLSIPKDSAVASWQQPSLITQCSSRETISVWALYIPRMMKICFLLDVKKNRESCSGAQTTGAISGGFGGGKGWLHFCQCLLLVERGFALMSGVLGTETVIPSLTFTALPLLSFSLPALQMSASDHRSQRRSHH